MDYLLISSVSIQVSARGWRDLRLKVKKNRDHFIINYYQLLSKEHTELLFTALERKTSCLPVPIILLYA